MIEFKSDCGHTVRARDEDAGKKVRCSYCGHEAQVPSSDQDDFDFLFHELERSEAAAKGKGAARAPAGPFSRGRRGEFNPFDVALKLVYATVLVTVIVVVYKKVIRPYYDESRNQQAYGQNEPGEPPPPERRREDQRRARRGGLMGLNSRGGLYIASFPAGTWAYYADAALKPAGRVADLENRARVRTGEQLTVPDGRYTVEVALVWNDPSLKRYPGYTDLRRKLQNAAGAAERDRIVNHFFLPDRADDVFVCDSEDQTYIVRQFHDVRTRSDRWTAVHALFIPADLQVEQAIRDYLPARTNYTFDEDHVRGELEYYNVPGRDRLFVLDALKRIGVWPYITVDPTTQVQRTYLFKIGIEDGMFVAPVLTEDRP